jgi:hypothetical protein
MDANTGIHKHKTFLSMTNYRYTITDLEARGLAKELVAKREQGLKAGHPQSARDDEFDATNAGLQTDRDRTET